MDDLIEAIIDLAGEIIEAVIRHKRSGKESRLDKLWKALSRSEQLSLALSPLLALAGLACILYALLAGADGSTKVWAAVAGALTLVLCAVLLFRILHRPRENRD